MLVVGTIIAALSIPSMLNAYSSARPVRLGGFLFLLGVVLVSVAILNNPNGYTFEDIPDAFLRVFARIGG